MLENLIKLIEATGMVDGKNRCSIIAEELISNGVTIPVRCKDCKHMEMTPDGLRWCNVWNGINGMGDEGFCNYGERRTDGR